MERTKYLISSLLILMTTACSNDDLRLASSQDALVALSVATEIEGGGTRAEKECFSEGDAIYITGRLDGEVQNSADLKYVRQSEESDSPWAPADADNTFYYLSADPVTFAAAYLCNQEVIFSEDGTCFTGLKADDSHEHDFLFASGAVGAAGTNNGKIYFDNVNNGTEDARFKHVMSKMNFKFIAGTDINGNTIDLTNMTFKVTGVVTTGTMNRETGVVSAVADGTPETITGEVISSGSTSAVGSILVFPQKVTDLKVIVTVDNFKYKGTPTGGKYTFNSATECQYDLYVGEPNLDAEF